MVRLSSPQRPAQDGRWTDGLRGFASILVMLSHVSRAFAPVMLEAQSGPDEAPIFAQLPFIRLFGSHWVAVFFVLLGYVNVQRPFKYARQGDLTEALSGLASSSLRRVLRLVLPTIFATLLSWIICQCGGYKLAIHADSVWMADSSPRQLPNMYMAVKSFFWNIWTMWTEGLNEYDRNHWTMFFLLRASFYLYMILLITIRATPRARMIIFGLVYAYCWLSRDVTIGFNVCAGAILAEWSMTRSRLALSENIFDEKTMQQATKSTFSKRFTRLRPVILLVIALFLCGYPDGHAEWAPWSRGLQTFGNHITVSGTELWRLFPGIGAQLIIVAVIISPSLQWFFSRPILLWLGRISFPIYLIHGSLLRSVLTWGIYSFGQWVTHREMVNGKITREWTELTSPTNLWVYTLVIPPWVAFVLGAAHLWDKTVEQWCVRITKKIESWTTATLLT